MTRYHTIDVTTGEVVHEARRNPWLQPLRQAPRKKPAYKPSNRRRPRADPITHLMTVAALLGGLVMFVEVIRLYSR